MSSKFDPYLNPPDLLLMSRPAIMGLILIILFGAGFLPWYSFSSGLGRVTAVNPSERIQEINAPIGGFIDKWHVVEGTVVEKGALLVELIDADPDLMSRILREREAAQEAHRSAQLALSTAKINLDRQRELFQEGLSSRKEYEKARIEHSKLAVEVSKALSTLTKAQTQVSRQSTQKITSPRDGTILRILPGEGNQLIKSGDPLVVFAPVVQNPAVELWINGNDIPFISVGQKAQLQFEGWPSVQIPGWPSLSINAFNAQVHLVDYASSHKGKFRVLLVASDQVWPSQRLLRLNANAKGIIYIRKTLIGIELWRQLNDFPPLVDIMNDELNLMLKKSKEDGK
jgi:biotin carboxyl carrier protein